MRVLAIDAGFRLGFGVIGARYVRSGSHDLRGSSAQMGEAFRSIEDRVRRLVDEHKPAAIAVARPFVGRMATPWNMRPIFGFDCKLQEIADALGLPWHPTNEAEARRAFLSPATIPRKSEQIKAAVMQAARDRRWPVCDDHAADALCVADFVYTKLVPERQVERTPLFRQRKR